MSRVCGDALCILLLLAAGTSAEAMDDNPAPHIEGRVRSALSEAPVTNAQVCVAPVLAPTTPSCQRVDAAGHYRTGALNPGDYYVKAAAPGHESQVFDGFDCEEPCDLTVGTVVTLQAGDTGASVADADFDLLPRAFSVRGTIVDGNSDVALPGVEVCLLDLTGLDLDLCAVTDATGAYAILGVPSRRYYAEADAVGFTSQLYRNVLCPTTCEDWLDAAALIEVSGPVTGIDFAMIDRGDGSSSISGHVSFGNDEDDDEDASGGDRRIANVEILVVDAVGTIVDRVITGRSGRYSFVDLPATPLYLVADGSERGFYSEIYNGATPGIVCRPAECAARVTEGVAVVPQTGLEIEDLDFLLSPGASLGSATPNELGRLGEAVVVCGQLAAVGVPGDDTAGTDAGAVLVFNREGTGYRQVQTLLPEPEEGSALGGRFGSALACEGNRLIVGAPADGLVAKGAPAGAKDTAYVMEMMGGSDQFTLLQQLVAANLGLTDGASFGSSVSLAGDVLAIGAPGSDAGIAFVFEPSNATASPWQMSAELSDPEGQPGDGFGTAVAASADGVVAVGSPNQEGTPGLATGVAQMFSTIAGTTDWTQVGKIVNPEATAGDGFGTAIALDGQLLAVGAPGADALAPNAGAVYLFDFVGASIEAQAVLSPGLPEADGGFGASIALAETTAIVGATGESTTAGPTTGAAYVFEQQASIWTQTRRIVPRLASPDEAFGTAVAADPRTIAIGAPNALVDGVRTGRAETFTDRDRLLVSSFES